MPDDGGIKQSIEFQLDALMLVSASGVSVDVREVMRELNIFEDLFSNTLTGSLFISDTQNLINVLPIVGAEYLVVNLVKPSTPFKISKVFRIYKISDRRKGTPNSEDYVLHFCSEELILSESIKISKSYKGMSVSAMVKDIATAYLKIDAKKFPASALTETTGNFDVVVPLWTPLYTINWISRMARNGLSPSCSFVFFEDGLGYNFKSIEELSQQEPVQVVNFMPVNLAGESGEQKSGNQNAKSDTQQRLESAEEYDMMNTPDMLRGIQSGLFAGKLMRVNILDQQIKTMTASGTDLFNNTKHTNKNTFIQTGQDRTKVIQTKHHDAFYRIAADNLKVETWMLQRNAYFSALHGFQIKVVLPGNMNMRAGTVVQLNLPAATVGLKEEKPMDILYSGKYLITAIRHKIDRTKYVCILELSKDSIEQPLPTPMEANPKMNKLRQL